MPAYIAGCDVQVYSDGFQNKIMKEVCKAYRANFVDTIYKLLNLGFPTFLVLSEDSNGQSEISAVCLMDI